jgi:putative transposase
VAVVKERAPVFTDLVLGRWCLGVLEETAEGAAFDLLAYCLMPDHLHVLVQGREDSSHLVTFLQRFKQRTGFRFKKESGDLLWQPSYFDRILRNGEDLAATADYIFQNPVAAGLTTEQEQYPLSGGVYFGGRQPDRTEVPSPTARLASSSFTNGG